MARSSPPAAVACRYISPAHRTANRVAIHAHIHPCRVVRAHGCPWCPISGVVVTPIGIMLSLSPSRHLLPIIAPRFVSTRLGSPSHRSSMRMRHVVRSLQSTIRMNPIPVHVICPCTIQCGHEWPRCAHWSSAFSATCYYDKAKTRPRQWVQAKTKAWQGRRATASHRHGPQGKREGVKDLEAKSSSTQSPGVSHG
jgi:hypothetical protein